MATTKAQLRQRIAAILQTLPSDSIVHQTEIVTRKVLSNPRYQQSSRVSIYLNTTGEISTVNLLEDMFRNGKSVFIPCFGGKNKIMKMVRLANMNDYHSLPMSTWNIKQPRMDEGREDALKTGGLDLVIAPGVAFTKDGKRLGHGRAYYDTFFSQHKQVCGCFPYSIALALNEQILDDLPIEEHDHIIGQVIYANTD